MVSRLSFAGRVASTTLMLAVVAVLMIGALGASNDAQAHQGCFAYNPAVACGQCPGPDSHSHYQSRRKTGIVLYCSYVAPASGGSQTNAGPFGGLPGSPSGWLLAMALAVVLTGGVSALRTRESKFATPRAVT